MVKIKKKTEKQLEKERQDIIKYLNKSIIPRIPKQYNHLELLTHLFDDDNQILTSITTRGDGKSYNFFNALMQISIKFNDFKFMLIARHFTIQQSYYTLLEKILSEQGIKKEQIAVYRGDDYVSFFVNNVEVALITDLNNATDLKYYSNILRDYRLIVYDEFLAIQGDYLIDEAERLKVIYESVDRGEGYLLEQPKILLLGNPVNFSSPLLSYFDMYPMLERQPINTIQLHKNEYGDGILIERRRNDEIKALKEANHRLFNREDNSSVTGEFKTNRALLASPTLIGFCDRNVTIKLDELHALTIHYSKDRDYYISIKYPRLAYDYALHLSDYTPSTPLIKGTWYSEIAQSRLKSGKVFFSDTFSLNYLDETEYLQLMDFRKIISHELAKKVDNNTHEKEVAHYKRTELENIKLKLASQFEF